MSNFPTVDICFRQTRPSSVAGQDSLLLDDHQCRTACFSMIIKCSMCSPQLSFLPLGCDAACLHQTRFRPRTCVAKHTHTKILAIHSPLNPCLFPRGNAASCATGTSPTPFRARECATKTEQGCRPCCPSRGRTSQPWTCLRSAISPSHPHHF
jgi:hypothetical protein